MATGNYVLDAEYDRRFDLSESSIEDSQDYFSCRNNVSLVIIFFKYALYAWTWRKFLPRHTGHTTLKSTIQVSLFQLKEFNNV